MADSFAHVATGREASEKERPACVLALSGGLDSAVLCAQLLAGHGAGGVLPVFFLYGSKHNAWERRAAEAVAGHFGLDMTVMDVRGCFTGASSALLADDPRAIPLVAYDADSMARTVVPGRNLIFASILAGLAENRGAGLVALATHSGDHHLYPDCRPDFNTALDACLSLSSDGKVRLLTPFASMTKADIVRLGLELGAPLHLTRSCYQNSERPCGSCGACLERREAFRLCGVRDCA